MATPPAAATPGELRERIRARALRRTVRLGGIFLVLTAGCFCILFYALRVRSGRVWEEAAASALARGDDVLAATLLQRARAGASGAVHPARLAALEAQLFALQERRQARAAQFRESLAKLEKMLDDGSWAATPAALEFAEAARLAPEEADLNAVRRLRLRYETLREVAATRRARQFLSELQALRNSCRTMAAERRSGKPATEAAWREAEARLADCKLRLREFPEFGEFFHAVAALAEEERAARREAAERRTRRDRTFAALVQSAAPADVRLHCEIFRREFADDPAAPAVRQLEQDLAWCGRPFDDAERRMEALREAEIRALERTRQILRALAAEAPGDTGAFARELSGEADRLTAADAAWFLERLLGDGGELPDSLRQALRQKLPEAASLLAGEGGTERNAAKIPAQFLLRKDFLKVCGETRPRFAGIWCMLPGHERKFYPAPDLRNHAEAWLPGDRGRFVRLGEIHRGVLFPAASAALPAAPGLRAVFTPEGPLGTAAGRAEWRRRAAAAGLSALPWPDFWPGDCRR